jgi:uncharacterized protein (TIGR02328 family)
MRLWHYKLLPYLPKSQLLAQKRECDLIWKDIANDSKTNHILINYIWKYEDYLKELSVYYWLLKEEFDNRGFTFNFSNNFITKNVFYGYGYKPFANHHNDRYLWQCFNNLQEKWDRGQKDFTDREYVKLTRFMEGKI